MKVSCRIEELRLRHTFTISRGSEDVTPTVIAEVEHEGIVGTGEASPSSFYGETPHDVVAALEGIGGWLSSADPVRHEHLLAEAAERLGNGRAALCALDLAVHDWFGRKVGQPLHRLLGLDPARVPLSTFTIGIDTPEKMVEKIREVPDFPLIKIKVGRPNDIDVVRMLRKETRAAFRVDANCAWTPAEAIEKSRELKALGVEFIEQPLSRESLDAMDEVYAKSALPVVADESSVVPEDVPRLPGKFHGINIKLVKCGGIRPALRMIHLARTLGLRIMIGCMIESSVCVTAGAQIGALVDWLDLDGAALTVNDPYRGMTFDRGRLRLPEGPGLGVSRARRT
jgi:L-alanine-DL-glutamate epimerase-like enolase superfamily enzyme